MAYDAQLAARVREMFTDDPVVPEQPMSGALAFVFDGRVAADAGADGGLQVHFDGEHTRSRRRLGEWIAVGITAATSSFCSTP